MYQLHSGEFLQPDTSKKIGSGYILCIPSRHLYTHPRLCVGVPRVGATGTARC